MWMRALALLKGVAATLTLFDPAVFQASPDELSAALSPGSAGLFARIWAQIANGGYRRARKTALAWWRADHKPRPAELHAAVAAAADQAGAWRHASTDGAGPHLPADLAGAEGAFGQLHTEMTALADWACIPDIGQLPITALQATVQALISDAETLFRLPELARLRASLRNKGLWSRSKRSATAASPPTSQVPVLSRYGFDVLPAVNSGDPQRGSRRAPVGSCFRAGCRARCGLTSAPQALDCRPARPPICFSPRLRPGRGRSRTPRTSTAGR